MQISKNNQILWNIRSYNRGRERGAGWYLKSAKLTERVFTLFRLVRYDKPNFSPVLNRINWPLGILNTISIQFIWRNAKNQIQPTQSVEGSWVDTVCHTVYGKLNLFPNVIAIERLYFNTLCWYLEYENYPNKFTDFELDVLFADGMMIPIFESIGKFSEFNQKVY